MAKFEMNKFVHRWMHRRAQVNMWRMPRWMSEDDLLQEGAYCWSLVNDKYHDVVTEVAHMVALFKTTYTNHITDLAKNVRNPRGEVSLDRLLDDSGDVSFLCDEPAIELLILDAPEPMQSILRLLTFDTERILTAPNRVYLDGRRDTVNNRIHRALVRQGIEIAPSTDILSLVHAYLNPRRERLYSDPSVVEVVSALVEDRVNPPERIAEKQHRPQLCYTPHLAKEARAKVKAYLKPKVRKRARMFPVVEVKNVKRDYAQAGVRCRTSHPQPQQQVQEHSRTSVRPRVHGDWKDCLYERRERRGDADRLQPPKVADERPDRGAVGPRPAAVGPGSAAGQRRPPEIRAEPAAGTSRGSQDRAPAVHTNSREPGRARVRRAGSTATRTRAAADARAAV